MPGLARKLVICAAVDGLIIEPLSSKGQRPLQPVKIRYGDPSISPISRDQIPETKQDSSFEAFGIIGLITVSKLSYLVTITKRQQVAQLFGFPIYVVTEVGVTPCNTRTDAEAAIRKIASSLQRQGPHSLSDESDLSEDDSSIQNGENDEVEDAVVGVDARPESPKSRVAEDVFRRRGSYGRFAKQWFSRSGWTQDQKRTMGMSNSPTLAPESPKSVSPSVSRLSLDDDANADGHVSELLPKLLRTAQVLFGDSRSFHFSYELDITRNLGNRQPFPDLETPLYAQVDSFFFWNRHVLQPFLDGGHDSLALPVMQGFVGQRSFVVDSSPPQTDDMAKGSLELHSLSPTGSVSASPPTEKTKEAAELRASERKYSVTVISRRSTKRAGLRYLRRGVNDDGFTANMVETEQILTPFAWENRARVYSYVQIRGSIPLFFTQKPYALKPTPVLQHSNETNYQACKKHFDRLHKSYGSLQVANLVEQRGIEEPIGTRYQRSVQRYNDESSDDKQVSFEWFDFHKACRGMKFENVSLLLDRLRTQLETFGSTIQDGGEVIRNQKGVVRTNCMDCLDRTNVCQSALAKHMLEAQLRQDGIDMSTQADQKTTWFNTLWADNGDAISKQYASTAAMKGDYTRTRKRDYRGALNDLGLSLARFYNGMVNDYFSQTAIDFLLGNVTAKVFDEFEADMMTKDPALSMSKMRDQAVELCHRRVVADEKEEFHGGWVLLSPNVSDSVKSWPLEEVVLLLTDAAMYLCRFDWDMDKVSSFERVQLANVTNIRFGTYITSTISPGRMDELRNVGIIVSYQPGKSDVRRTNTRTFSSVGDLTPEKPPPQSQKDASQAASLASLLAGKSKSPAIRRLVFKAPYTDSSTAVASNGPQQTEIQQVVTICADIERLALECQPHRSPDESKSIIEKGDIISLEAARKNTSLFEQLGHSIKKLVWA